ncbi:MAG: pantoate--beta-alanine ligase [Nitrospirales bacterium]|nr:pantoate--beta-alanine ligase [Nitrospirales bacterium]
MRIIRTVRSMKRWSTDSQLRGDKIGFIPTMGALHAGHQSLLQRARRTCDRVVASLFVNPLQFGPAEDLTQYPRKLKQDIALCRQEGVDLLFIPSSQEIYPDDFQTIVMVAELSQRWEGQERPTHFQGVGTIVTKLLNLVRPHRAFFGQKDYQQALLVQRLVKDLSLPVKIVMCPTIRENDGLALSSRNTYLSREQREQATVLYSALKAGKAAIKKGMRSAGQICQIMKRLITNKHIMTIDYLAVCHPLTLEPLTSINGQVILLGALRLGNIRLIDNLLVHAPQDCS